MAARQWLSRSVRTIGSDQVALADVDTAILRIDARTTVFDDPSLTFVLTVEHSPDNGLTWPVSYRATIVGGARGKDGSLPNISLSHLPDGLLRFNLTVNRSVECGLDGETITREVAPRR
jgi:hypothetical protein